MFIPISRSILGYSYGTPLSWLFALMFVALALLSWPAQARANQTELLEANALMRHVEEIWGGSNHTLIETKLRRALSLREKNLPADHPAIVESLAKLGHNDFNRREYVSAERHYRRALALVEPSGPSMTWHAMLLGDLAAALREQGAYSSAEPLARRSLAMRRRLVAPNDLWISSGLDNLGQTLQRQGRFKQALAVYREAYAIRKAGLEPGHWMVAKSNERLEIVQNALAPWSRLAGELAAALPLSLIGLLFTTVVEARASSDRALRASVFVLIVSSVALGYCGYVASRVLVPTYFPDLKIHVGGAERGPEYLVALVFAAGALYAPAIINRVLWNWRGRNGGLIDMLQFWKRRSFDEMTALIASCDIEVRPRPVDGSQSTQPSWPPPAAEIKRIEKGGFDSLLIEMSDHSDDVWHFDAETIYDHGDYKEIVENLCRLSTKALVFDSIRDFVDVEKGIAWIELTREGRTERIDLSVNDDWVDDHIFEVVQSYLIATGTARRFTVMSLGQDCLVACMMPQQMQDLRRATSGSIWFQQVKPKSAA